MKDISEYEFDVSQTWTDHIEEEEPAAEKKFNLDTVISAMVVLLLAATAAATVMNPPKAMSEKENRELASFPELTINTLLDGTFMSDFDTFSADQFVFRDRAVSLKADIERLMGKSGNNGVFFAKDGYLIARPSGYNEQVVTDNINAIKDIKDVGGYNMTVSLVPTAFEVLKDKLPSNAYIDVIPQIRDKAAVMLADSGIGFCDPTDALAAHKDEYIYYRTDHHQTALGSYYLYCALGESLGYEPFPLESFDVETLSDEFYGTSWSKSSVDFHKPDSVEKFTLRGTELWTQTQFPLENKIIDGMYVPENVQKKDKYTVYLDGNHGLTEINTGAGTGRNLAVLKDSYAHSLAPFLANHFDNIYLIDMRYYNDDFFMFLDEKEVTDMLVLYNTENFSEDANLKTASEIAQTTEFFQKPPFGYLDETEAVDDSYFNDAVFFGDSLTVGHSEYTSLPAQFICKSATNSYNCYTETLPSGNTMINALFGVENVKKYYIMFGLNEIALETPEKFKENFRTLVRDIKAHNPQAIIYLESIPPIEHKEEEKKLYKYQIEAGNAQLIALAEEEGCYYVDVFSWLAEPDGYLPTGAAADGVHFGKEQHDLWDACLRVHAVPTARKFDEGTAVVVFAGGGNADVLGYAADITASVEFADAMNQVSDNSIMRMFGLEPCEALQGIVYTGGGSTAEEFAIFETDSPEKAQALGEKLRMRVENRKPDFETYKPEEMAKLNDPVIEVHGNVAMMCVSNNNDAARAVMSKY